MYRIPCRDCNQTYTGETAQIFEDRRNQHKSCVKTGEEKNEIAVHVMKTKHSIDWDNFSFLDSDRNYNSRKVEESIYINCLVGGGDYVNSIANLEKRPCKLVHCWNGVYPGIRDRVQKRSKKNNNIKS